jgi:hypothetical protein
VRLPVGGGLLDLTPVGISWPGFGLAESPPKQHHDYDKQEADYVQDHDTTRALSDRQMIKVSAAGKRSAQNA